MQAGGIHKRPATSSGSSKKPSSTDDFTQAWFTTRDDKASFQSKGWWCCFPRLSTLLQEKQGVSKKIISSVNITVNKMILSDLLNNDQLMLEGRKLFI